MNITRETKANQHDIIKIEISKEDYKSGFESKLKKYSKEVSINGFRKGAAPVGMVKKMYGESILAEEINKLTDEAIQGYIKDNQVKLLGRPMLAEGQEQIDIQPNLDKTYQIAFEIGYEADYSIALDGIFSKFEIDVTSDMIEKEVENVKKHFTKLEDSADPIGEGDTIYFNFSNNQSIQGESFCSTDELTENGKAAFIGKKLGDKLDLISLDTFNNEKLDVKKYILNIAEPSEQTDAEVASPINFEITNVKKKFTPETLTEEQIAQVTRDESKKSMDDLRSSLEEDIRKQYQSLAQNFLRNDVYEYVLDNTNISLPDDFLKRWIVSEKENNLTPEQVEKEYDNIGKSIKWDLITSKFVQEHNIKVEAEEVRNEFKTRYAQYFLQSGYNPPAEQLEQFASEAMKDQKNVRKTFEQLLDTKILDKMTELVKTNAVTYTEEQFIEESKKRNEKRQNPAHGEEGHVHDEHCGHNH